MRWSNGVSEKKDYILFWHPYENEFQKPLWGGEKFKTQGIEFSSIATSNPVGHRTNTKMANGLYWDNALQAGLKETVTTINAEPVGILLHSSAKNTVAESELLWLLFILLFWLGSLSVAQVRLETTRSPRLALNSQQCPCLNHKRARIANMRYHICLVILMIILHNLFVNYKSNYLWSVFEAQALK